jgi:hypothetical protein
MDEPTADASELEPPKSGKVAKISRGALRVIGGAIPLAGGLLSAIAGACSEAEQQRFNQFFEHWIQMLRNELREKEKTVLEIMCKRRRNAESEAALKELIALSQHMELY